MGKLSNRQKNRRINTLLLAIFTIPGLWVVFNFGNSSNVFFWVAVLGQIILAFFANFLLSRIPIASLAILVISWVFPVIMEARLGVDRLQISAVMFIYGAFWMILVTDRHPLSKRKSEISEQLSVPNLKYIPLGYKEAKITPNIRKNKFTVETIFDNDNDETIIQLVCSNKLIPSTHRKKNMTTIIKHLGKNDIRVHHEINIKSKDRSPFIEMNWQMNNVFYQLRSDGISIEEAEKIITSMIS